MNFKRFISGVSALAVASGAFAGMAISANAAEPGDVIARELQTEYTTSIDVTGDSIAKAPGLSINASVGTGTASYIELEPINATGKAISFKLTVPKDKSASGNVYFYNNKTGKAVLANIQLNNSYGLFYVYGHESHIDRLDAQTGADVLLQVGTNNALTIYLNGKNIGYVTSYNDDLGYIELTRSGNQRLTYTFSNIQVTDMPATYTVTGGGVEGTYITGTEVTLGDAGDGMVWSDGENTYESGSSYNVTKSVTLTAVAVTKTESKAFAFDTITAANDTKTVKVTVDGVTKSGTIDLNQIDGDVKLAIVINDIPTDAKSVTAVIE